jgi:hypothetical protein
MYNIIKIDIQIVDSFLIICLSEVGSSIFFIAEVH